ncbi:MAG: hypothetical protein K6T85_09445 [Gorillibacterium sp.]|nr:hypothetical protein [Gorillibacterium sp.]
MKANYLKETQRKWKGKVGSVSKRFWKDEAGLGTLEMLMILAVLVLIAIAFRKWIIKWVNTLFNSTDTKITNTSTSVSEPVTT